MSDDIATARALGELSANLSALGRSIDLLRSDAASRDGALDAKITEVANQQRVSLEGNARLSERLENHLKLDETNHLTIMNEISVAKGKLDDLLTWRGKILGGMALIGILIGIFGHTLAGWVGEVWHAAFK